MAVALTDIAVTGIVTEQETTETGLVRDLMRVYYNIGEYGPYSVVIPKLEVTAQRVLMDIRQDAQKLLDILNLQF